MKKNSLTTAIVAGVAGVAGLAGVAHAVNLNADGIGQVLLYPYYTVNGGNSTLISVVNTSDMGKAVKVRFLESLNSKEVLDFNLYLSPYDVWTANIHENAAGKPGIITNDTSCIAPLRVMGGAFTEFLDYEFASWRPDLLGKSTTPASVAKNNSRKRQGHIEVIEMGDLVGAAHTNSKHGMNGGSWKPLNCAWFANQWSSSAPGTWLSESGGVVDQPNYGKGLHSVCAPGAGYLVDPANPNSARECHPAGGQGGIFGGAFILNLAEGTAYSYNAEALNGFYTIGAETAPNPLDKNLHYAPGTVLPSLEQATNAYSGGNYYAFARVFDASGNPFDMAFVRSTAPQAVSAVLSARYVANEYTINGITAAVSDWVVTFPTKQLHTYRLAPGAIGGLVDPFTQAQGAGGHTLNPFTSTAGNNTFMGSLPEVFSLRYWDREEGEPTETPGVIDVSPLPPPGETLTLAFRQEANVLTFYTKDGVDYEDGEVHPGSLFAAPLGTYAGGYAVALEAGFNSGWARIGFDTQSLSSAAAAVGGTNYGAWTIHGLPVIGFWATRHLNGAAGANNLTAYYNIIHRHRVTREITPFVAGP